MVLQFCRLFFSLIVSLFQSSSFMASYCYSSSISSSEEDNHEFRTSRIFYVQLTCEMYEIRIFLQNGCEEQYLCFVLSVVLTTSTFASSAIASYGIWHLMLFLDSGLLFLTISMGRSGLLQDDCIRRSSREARLGKVHVDSNFYTGASLGADVSLHLPAAGIYLSELF